MNCWVFDKIDHERYLEHKIEGKLKDAEIIGK